MRTLPLLQDALRVGALAARACCIGAAQVKEAATACGRLAAEIHMVQLAARATNPYLPEICKTAVLHLRDWLFFAHEFCDS